MRHFAILFALLCLASPTHAVARNGNGVANGNVVSQADNGTGNGKGNGNAFGKAKPTDPDGLGDIDAGATLSPEGAAAASDQNLALKAVQQGDALPLSEIAKRVREQFGARVIDAHLVKQKTGLVYRLTILTDQGVTRKIEMDAKAGTTGGVD